MCRERFSVLIQANLVTNFSLKAYFMITSLYFRNHLYRNIVLMDPKDHHVLIHLREIEEAAENVLADKQEIIDLDRRRHANREALSALDKSAKSHWKGDDSRTWLTMNNCFIQMKTGKAKELVKLGV